MKKYLLLLGLFFVPSIGFSALSKTYPTAATTGIRNDTYIDGITTIYDSTYTVNVSTWNEFYIDGWVIFSSTVINGYTYRLEGSTYTLRNATWSLQGYSEMLMMQGKLKGINQILDNDMEQYMVFTSSYLPNGMQGWKGWCSQMINGHRVPTVCP